MAMAVGRVVSVNALVRRMLQTLSTGVGPSRTRCKPPKVSEPPYLVVFNERGKSFFFNFLYASTLNPFSLSPMIPTISRLSSMKRPSWISSI